MAWLTVAIPTMRRFNFLQEQIPIALARPEVAEVLLCDETGEDAAALALSPWAQNPKLRVVINEKRLGIYQNKRRCIELAVTPMVAVLDSDNAFNDEWFDTLAEAVKEHGHTTIYASADFMTVDSRTGTIDRPCLKWSDTWIKTPYQWNTLLTHPQSDHLTNDGNWVVPRERALAALPSITASESLQAVDALYMLRCFIVVGLPIWYVPGLTYLHRVHDGSAWLETEKESMRILNSRHWGIHTI